MSPSTKHKDRKTNKTLYEKTFRTPEYFLYDPASQQLDGWRLVHHVYQPLAASDRGWLWSEELNLWLGKWEGRISRGAHGVWLRFFNSPGELVPTPEETQRQRAEAERERAEAAEAEVARLRAIVDQRPPSTH